MLKNVGKCQKSVKNVKNESKTCLKMLKKS